jgi:hypothetical protein
MRIKALVVGALMLLGFIFVVHVSLVQRSWTPAPRLAPTHGWFVAYRADFWDSMKDRCLGWVHGITAALDPEPDITPFDAAALTSAMPGHHNLGKGTRVSLLGHGSFECLRQEIRLTRVEIADPGAALNGKVGYIEEGFLEHR